MFVKKKMNSFPRLQLLVLVLIFSCVAAQVVPQDHETKGNGEDKTVDDCIPYEGFGRRGRCASYAANPKIEEATLETQRERERGGEREREGNPFTKGISIFLKK
ncbi:acanthoscurrin-2-like [Pyrus ussuriensis x Pyrus communis]|uniref:Acanthoscurrin-2-like n=1 Tax=Pyrus ussuriensis x Pyrus communis TaxID=2448454 RepID=A0A5N5GDH1_9ROSA|nr:acanthoscurrin-2-like [Pyrus ussuriensis x Pyrus communis]